VELSESIDLTYFAVSYEPSDGRWMLTATCANCSDQEYHTSTLNFAALGFATQYPGLKRVISVKLKAVF